MYREQNRAGIPDARLRGKARFGGTAGANDGAHSVDVPRAKAHHGAVLFLEKRRGVCYTDMKPTAMRSL